MQIRFILVLFFVFAKKPENDWIQQFSNFNQKVIFPNFNKKAANMYIYLGWVVVACAFNPNAQKAEAGESLWVRGQPGL